MRRIAVATLIVCALAACRPLPGAVGGGPTATPPAPGASPAPGGCGATPLYQGAIPAWLEEADGHNTPRGLPYAVAAPPDAAAFLFAHPLRAGHPSNPANKILWVVRGDRQGQDLALDAHPLGAPSPAVHMSRPPDSGPGNIYPSIVDVPSAGCWHFSLRWATGQAEVDLDYAAG